MISLNKFNYIYFIYFFKISALMKEICSKLKLGDVNIMDKILSEQNRIIWESMGLTPDVQSMENAALLTKVLRFSFFNLSYYI